MNPAVKTQRFSSSEVDDEAVRSFLVGQPAARPYHRVEWLRAAQDAYGHDFFYLTANDDEGLRGVLPLCRFRSPIRRERLVSIPYCDVGGPVVATADAESALHRALVEQVASGSSATAELRLENRLFECDALYSGKVCMVLDLPSDPDTLMSSFKAKVRSQIRKAGKNGLHCETTSSPDGIDEFYSVYCRNMRDLGSPCHSRAWFAALKDQFGKEMLIARVWKDADCVGAAILLLDGKTACVPWASTWRDYNHLARNMLLYWELLRVSLSGGASLFDFGRSSYGEGTYRFKRQWGAKPIKLEWVKVDREGAMKTLTATEPGVARRSAEWCWRQSPLWLANLVGRRVRGYIAL